MIAAVTGHRPPKLGGYSDEARKKLEEFAKKVLQSIKPDIIITGMALGWDQATAVAAIELGIPFHAYVPFEGQERRWPRESQDRYRSLLAKADRKVICIPGGYTREAMMLRNRMMVDSADMVIAMYDGSGGGTANAVRYAKMKGKRVINVYNDWKNDGMSQVITHFRGDYFFLSNFYPAKVVFDGVEYPHAEAAYQAAKSTDSDIRKQFQDKQLTGAQAKKLGKRIVLRADWPRVRLNIMEEIVRSKFNLNDELKKKLLATGDAELIEENYWNDTFWGKCNGKGSNHLGRILMKIRKELKDENI